MGETRIVIDLNRLREAGEFEMIDRVQIEREAVQAVLDAPTVWWCFTHMRESGQGHGIDHTQVVCELCDAWEGCGWVALVPITGEGR
jgi:hypothetical protein